MADYQYTFPELGVHKSSHTARLAVLWPTMSNVLGSNSCPANQLIAITGLHMLWRRRISELHEEQCPRLLQPRHLQYARNCPPPVCKTENKVDGQIGKRCKIYHLCPWCYSDKVIGVYDRAVQFLCDADKLLYARHDQHIKFDASPTKQQLRSLLTQGYDTVTSLAKANSEKCNGIYWMVAMAPVIDVPNTVVLSTGLLAMMYHKENFVLIPPTWTSMTYTPPVGKDQLSEAISRALHYQPGLLKGDPVLTTRIMEARHRLRLTNSCGCLRGVSDDS